MNREELQEAVEFIFSTPFMQKRKANAITALRRRGMDDETRGYVIGQVDILDFMEQKLVDSLFQEQDSLSEFPQSAPEAERVAPLPRRIDWATR